MFDVFDTLSKFKALLKEALSLAQERTPTQRDRIAEQIFVRGYSYGFYRTDKDQLWNKHDEQERRALAVFAYSAADSFLDYIEEQKKR